MRSLALALAGMTVGATLGATSALARGDALVIGNSQYSAVQALFGAQRVAQAASALQAKGFDVSLAQDAGADDMRAAFGAFTELLDDDGGPVVILLSGAFVHSVNGSYLLPVTGNGTVDEAEVLVQGFPLDAALTVLSTYQGRAFLVLGETEVDPELTDFLQAGVGALDVPQGVTVIRGPAVDVARYAARDMARTGRFVRRAAIEYELSIEGYAPRGQVVVRPQDVSPPRGAVEPPLSDPFANSAADNAAWRLAQEADSAEGYRTYLDGFAQGAHVNAARQRLKAINDEPFYRQRRAEDDLEMNRDDRRAIQRALTILGYNTRGIDGVFGKGSRGAIKSWQKDMGLEQTSYLNRRQIVILQASAKRRAAELEEEEKRKQEELARQERVVWRRIQERGEEDGFRQYLQTYPEGQFVDEARAVLRGIDQRRAERAAGQDRRSWAKAVEADSVDAYNAYLKGWPNGAFVAEAKERIAALNRNRERARNAAAAKREENSMNLNYVTRQLAERQLNQLKMNPGKVDGRFDDNTRAALRRFQQSRGLRVSGYLDEQTVVRLLSDGLLGNGLGIELNRD